MENFPEEYAQAAIPIIMKRYQLTAALEVWTDRNYSRSPHVHLSFVMST